jgi:hypothetical protein
VSLETLTRALLQQAFSSILEEELFASLPNLLTPTLYINQREFLRKARDDERQALLASYVRLLAHYGARITPEQRLLLGNTVAFLALRTFGCGSLSTLSTAFENVSTQNLGVFFDTFVVATFATVYFA